MAREMSSEVEIVRRFNRFYTKQIGLLTEAFLKCPFSLSEARLIYELATRSGRLSATDLCRELDLDPGYLSRILQGFEKRGLIEKTPCKDDGRRSRISLTEQGRKEFAELDSASRREIEIMLSELPEEGRRSLVGAMETIEAVLGGSVDEKVPYILRAPRPGDFGWVVQRHGALYAREYGWDERFEALVAEIVAKFVREFDPKREACWIAERNGENVGSVFLVKVDEETAKLRLLIVEPDARGLGIGSRLVEECILFARRTRYRKMTLWTNSVLLAARRIYEKAGFRIVKTGSHHSFGKDLTEETWELDL